MCVRYGTYHLAHTPWGWFLPEGVVVVLVVVVVGFWSQSSLQTGPA